MFAIDCPHHGARTLTSIDQILRYENTDAGVQLIVECWCGGLVTVVNGKTLQPASTAA